MGKTAEREFRRLADIQPLFGPYGSVRKPVLYPLSYGG